MKKITEGVVRARKAYQDANGEGWYRMNYLLDHEHGISVEYGYEDVSQIPVQGENPVLDEKNIILDKEGKDCNKYFLDTSQIRGIN